MSKNKVSELSWSDMYIQNTSGKLLPYQLFAEDTSIEVMYNCLNLKDAKLEKWRNVLFQRLESAEKARKNTGKDFNRKSNLTVLVHLLEQKMIAVDGFIDRKSQVDADYLNDIRAYFGIDAH